MEKEIELEQEAIVVYSGGGAVSSVNGYTGDVVLTTSDLENTSDYQTGTEVESAISTAIAGKQDTLTAGNNITISNNTISATDTTYSAGTGLTLNGTQFSVDTSTIATQQDVSNEATARENADTNLQGQIDAISAASDVTDIVGTYAALQAYDTTHLKDNDIIKVLQDESQDDETTYYRWSTSTHTFTLIGEEGPYYTKSQADTLLNAKQNTLTAGSNVQIVNDTISATDTTYTAGTGLALNGTQFSVDTTAIATQSDLTAGLATKQDTLTAGTNIQINNNTISATDTTYSAFTGTDGTAAGTAGLVPAPATTDAGKFLKADGTWDTAGGGSGPTVVQTTGTSTTDVMSQNATTSMVFADPSDKTKVKIGDSNTFIDGAATAGIVIGPNAKNYGDNSLCVGSNSIVNFPKGVALGAKTTANGAFSVALGTGATTSVQGEINVGTGSTYTTNGYNGTNYRLISGIHDGQNAHDAATVGQLTAYSVVSGAGAPTTSTAAQYIGQFYYDTTNDGYYYCTAITAQGTTPETYSYTWAALSTGGGSGPTVVQTTGTSTTDVMSQNAATSMVFADPATATRVSIGNANAGTSAVSIGQGAYGAGEYSVALGYQANTYTGGAAVALGQSARARASKAIAIGYMANSGQDGGASSVAVGSNTRTGDEAVSIGEGAGSGEANTVAIGRNAKAQGRGSVAIGDGSVMPSGYVRGTVSFYTNAIGYGYNGSSNYRLLTGLYDPQSAHDAATKGYVDPTTDSSAPTTATVGRLGQIQIDTTTATAYMCVEADDVTPSYTWKQITA